jgi:hypothetical protein
VAFARHHHRRALDSLRTAPLDHHAAAELTALAGRVGLAGADRVRLDCFVADGLCAVMRGNYEWGNTSERYEATEVRRWLGARPELPR